MDEGKVNPTEQLRASILEIVTREGAIDIGAVAELLDVSVSRVRRSARRLAKERKLNRAGGCLMAAGKTIEM